MALPGVEIQDRESAPPRVAQVNTGTLFAVGLTERGPLAPTLLTSLAQAKRLFGPRVSWSIVMDYLETFFADGGARAYFARALGPAPTVAGIGLSDGTAATLQVSAASPGEWGNALSVQVVAGSVGGTFVLVVTQAGVEVERSPDLADTAAAIAWALSSTYVRATELAGAGDPVVSAAAPLTAGTDDRTNITDVDYRTALGLLTRDLGPGQVVAPGRTTAQAHTDLAAHATANNRRALLDVVNTTTAATLRASGAAVRALAEARNAALFAPWVTIPGLVAGTTRTVPASAVAAGLMAREDLRGGPGSPAAGDRGRSSFARGVAATFSDADRASLNDAGVNVLRLLSGGVTVYGYNTPVPTAELAYLPFGGARLVMLIKAQAESIADRYLFRRIDGRGLLAGEMAGDLRAMLDAHYQAGSLYGEDADDAYRVETDPPVNTPQTAAAGELRAILGVRTSPHAERVVIELARVAITEVL